jgi:hypothetical protein
MRAAIPTDLLSWLMTATDEDLADLRRYIGHKAPSGNQKSDITAEYRLRKQMGMWEIVHAGQRAVLDDCRAVELVAHLLKHPPAEGIHASEWERRVDGNPLIDGFAGIGQAEDDGRPPVEVGEVGGVIQERTGRKFLGGISLPGLKAELSELRAASLDVTLPEAEREEAREKLMELLRAHDRGGKLIGERGRAVDRVRKQIKTLIRELKGASNDVLRSLGQHLDECLWLPSMGGRKRAGAACQPGCFTYEPPAGVVWGE